MPELSRPLAACMEVLQSELKMDPVSAQRIAGDITAADEPQRASRLRNLLRHPALREHALRCLRRDGTNPEHLGRLLVLLLSLPEQDPLQDWLVRFAGSPAYRALLQLGQGRFGDQDAAREADRIALGLAVESSETAEQFARAVGLPAFRTMLQRLPVAAPATRAATLRFVADACRTSSIYEVRQLMDLLSEEPGLPAAVEDRPALRIRLLEAARAAALGDGSRPRYRQVLRMLATPLWRKVLDQHADRILRAIDLALLDLSFTPDTLNTFCEVWGADPSPGSRLLTDRVLDCPAEHLKSLIGLLLQSRTRRALARVAGDAELQLLLVEEIIACTVGTVPPAFAAREVRNSLVALLTDPAIPIARLSEVARFRSWLAQRDSSRVMREQVQAAVFRDLVWLAARKNASAASPRPSHLQQKLDGIQAPGGAALGIHPRRASEQRRGLAEVHRWLSDLVWARAGKRFGDREYSLRILRTIAESAGLVDPVLAALEELDPEDLDRYAGHLQRAWEQEPQRIAEETDSRAPWAIRFNDARPFIMEALLPLVGTIPVYPADWAKTEGAAIYLPESIAFFRDDPDALDGNRNLAMYVFLALHEAGHLLAGSFTVDPWPLFREADAPGLYAFLYNVVEDVRIERWIVDNQVHSQIRALVDAAHGWFLGDATPDNPINASIGWLWDHLYANGRRQQTDPEWAAGVVPVLDTPLQGAGQLARLGDGLARSLQRIRIMETGNPAAALQIAGELYRMLLPLVQGTESLNGLTMPGETGANPGDPGSRPAGSAPLAIPNGGMRPGASGAAQRVVATAQDIADLYREANAHPERFVLGDSRSIGPGHRTPDTRAAEVRDDMRHTAADYRSGRRQRQLADLRRSSRELDSVLASVEPATALSGKSSNAGQSTSEEPRVVRVRSWDPSTQKRLRMSEVREFVITTVDPEFLRRHQDYAAVAQRLRGLIHRLLHRDESDVEGASVGDEWDMDALLEILADFQSDRSREVLLTPALQRRDARLAIGMDVSGSTATLVSNRDYPVSILDMEKHFALLFADAFESLGVPVELYGFNSITSTNIYLPQTPASISAFVADNANRDGDFIRWVTNRLTRDPAELQYFLLISDGMPSSPNYEGQPAVEDTLLAMRECRMAGIRLVYINVDPAAESYFESFRVEADSAIRCRSAAELPDLLPRLVHDLGIALR